MSDLAILNKVDLASAMNVNVKDIINGSNELYPQLEVIPTSTKTGIGMDKFAEKIGLE
jgi:Ni2+-binding GTPase involved in maturation of urease and hydrogenase